MCCSGGVSGGATAHNQPLLKGSLHAYHSRPSDQPRHCRPDRGLPCLCTNSADPCRRRPGQGDRRRDPSRRDGLHGQRVQASRGILHHLYCRPVCEPRFRYGTCLYARRALLGHGRLYRHVHRHQGECPYRRCRQQQGRCRSAERRLLRRLDHGPDRRVDGPVRHRHPVPLHGWHRARHRGHRGLCHGRLVGCPVQPRRWRHLHQVG